MRLNLECFTFTDSPLFWGTRFLPAIARLSLRVSLRLICLRSSWSLSLCSTPSSLYPSVPCRPGAKPPWRYWAAMWWSVYLGMSRPLWWGCETWWCLWEPAISITTSLSLLCSWARWITCGGSGRLYTTSPKSPSYLWVSPVRCHRRRI